MLLFRICTMMMVAMLFASTSNAQRVFRASSLDIEQNERLDSMESKVSRIEASVAAIAEAVKKQTAPIQTPALVHSLPATTTTVSLSEVPLTLPPPTAVRTEPAYNNSPYYSQAELIGIVQRAYPPLDSSGRRNYTKYADVSPRSGVWTHLQDSNHRFTSAQISGLPQDIALGLHGLHHAGLIKATRGSAAQTQHYASTTSNTPVRQPSYSPGIIQSAGGCANGQCARPSYQSAQPRFRLFRR